jgi:hypothetical protein
MSTHLHQYIAACRLEDDLRAAAAHRALPREARAKTALAPIARLRRLQRALSEGSSRLRHVG